MHLKGKNVHTKRNKYVLKRNKLLNFTFSVLLDTLSTLKSLMHYHVNGSAATGNNK